jgi:hypothetical protein
VSRSHRSSAGSGTLSDSGFGLNVDEDAMGMVDWRRRRVTTDEREGKGIMASVWAGPGRDYPARGVPLYAYAGLGHFALTG